MKEIVFIRFEGGSLDAQHLMFERGQSGEWPPPKLAYFVRTGGDVIVWGAKEDGSKPDQLKYLKIDRYRRVQSTVPSDGAESPGVHGALYRYDPESEAEAA